MIDGAEWVGPYDDEKLGFNRIAQLLLLPGLVGAGPSTEFMVNRRPGTRCRRLQGSAGSACAEACHLTAASYDALNPPALRRLIANGAQLRPFPREVMAAFYRAAQEL